MRRRLLRWLAAAPVLAIAAGWLVINFSADDPARWHVDPATITLRGTPNELLAATPGTTAATPHATYIVHRIPPRELLACVDAIARARPRVSVLVGDVDSLMITYVQRSRIVGFPDYITVRAVAQDLGQPEGGAGLIVYSRSRYGHGDFGVNRHRVGAWLVEAGSIC